MDILVPCPKLSLMEVGYKFNPIYSVFFSFQDGFFILLNKKVDNEHCKNSGNTERSTEKRNDCWKSLIERETIVGRWMHTYQKTLPVLFRKPPKSP